MKHLIYLTLLILVSCSLTRTIEMSDYNQSMQANLQKADKQIKNIDVDLEGHQKIQTKWADGKSKQQLSKLTQKKQNIMQYYYRLKEDIESRKFKEVPRITSKDRIYDDFIKQDRNFEERFEILNKQLQNYETESKGLNDYLASKKIYVVDKQKVSTDFRTALNESKKSQLRAKNELIEYSVNASPSKKKLIAELSRTIEQMENETFKLQRLYSASMKELESGVRYVTPGMKSFDHEGKIKNHQKVMEKLIEAFNSKAKGLKE